MTKTQENASGPVPDSVASSPAEESGSTSPSADHREHPAQEPADREQGNTKQTHARLRPRVLRSGAANFGHVVSIATALPVAVGLMILGFDALPSGLILWVFAAALLGWIWLAARAIGANRKIDNLVKGGHVLPGRVESLSVQGDEYLVTWTCVIPALDPDGSSLTIRRSTHVNRWESRRYHESMQVMVVFDPTDPEKAALFPPPGGGGGIDILGDCLAQLFPSETTKPPPE